MRKILIAMMLTMIGTNLLGLRLDFENIPFMIFGSLITGFGLFLFYKIGKDL